MSWLKGEIEKRYTGANGLDLGNIAKDLGVAGALYSLINPNDSSGIAKFLGTGGQQAPVGYTGGIPNYTATRELVPNAFASTYTTPTGEVAPRRPGMAGRRYFTDTQFTQSTDEPFMGITAEQIAAQNQAAIDDQAFFGSLLGGAATQRMAGGTGEDYTEGMASTGTTGSAYTETEAQRNARTSAIGSEYARKIMQEPGEYNVGVTEDRSYFRPAITWGLFDQGLTPEQLIQEGAYFEYIYPGSAGEDGLQKAYEYWQQNRAGPDEIDDGGIEQTPRELYTSLLNQIDASDRLDEGEQFTIAKAITEGGFGVDEIATRYDAQPVDVIEGLLRGGFQTPEEIVGLYNTEGFDEAKLVAILLDQGKTTPEEVAAYYKDHPVYGGITPEQVIQEFRARGGEREFAQGGNVNGYYLGGPTDGMADQIPATINNMQPAALSDGEFVIPADVVSHLGNGNSDSGAKNLYSMMDRIRQDRTGTTKQGRQIDPNKYLA